MDEFKPLNLFGNDEEKSVPDSEEQPVCETEACDTGGSEATGSSSSFEDATAVKEEAVVEEGIEKPAESSSVEEDTLAEEITDDATDEEDIQPDKLDQILEAQHKLSEGIEALNALFNARIMHTDHEEKIVDQMHKELQKYKEDMYSQLVRPILLDVIEVRDSIMRMAATYLAKPEGEQSIPNKTFSDYAYDLQDILEKNSVEIYRSKLGDDFTPIKQRVIKKVATTDEALHGKVAESLSCGYSYNGRTISAEKITVYYYEKPVENIENSQVIENG